MFKKSHPLRLGELPNRIGDLPRKWAKLTPDDIALVQEQRTWTWLEFTQIIDKTSEFLTTNGVRAGDRVMVVCENCQLVPCMLFAITNLNAWAVIVNARLSDQEVDNMIEHCQPRRVIYTSCSSPNASSHAERHQAQPYSTDTSNDFHMGALNTNCSTEQVHKDPAQQIALIVYTSGTSGAPKGVMLSHQNISYIARTVGELRDTTQADYLYLVLPLSHIYGLSSSLLGLVTAGACIELVPRFDPAHVVNAFRRGVSMFHGTPLMFAKILEYCRNNQISLQLPGIRFISAGGSPLDITLKQEVEEAFGIPLNNGYGITECSPTVAQTLSLDPQVDDTVGYLLPGIQSKVIDNLGATLNKEEVGTLFLRGVSIMKGYYRDPEKTAEVIDKRGWYNTGDLARFSANGNLYIVGRSKELIIRSGFNVYPIEVESALTSHPSVMASAVVGREIPGNEEVIAYVQLEAGKTATPEEILQHIRGQLAPYKRPAHIIILDKLPTGATGKILKSELSAHASKL